MQGLGLALSDMADTDISPCVTSTSRRKQNQPLKHGGYFEHETMNGAKL
jgi:hypothetical protein